MKYKLIFALVASVTSTAYADFKAPLPEFKNEKQLAGWRAERATEATSQGYTTEEAAFYTGRPYVVSSGGYTFKYRSYKPELARWTSEDPSGFPDGANSYCYINNQTTNSFDFLGLKKVLWLYGNGGDATADNELFALFTQHHTAFKKELTELDKGDPSPRYLSDGDTFDIDRFDALGKLAETIASYDHVYLAAHGAKDANGVYNGGWILGDVEFGASVFKTFKKIEDVYGCNPIDGAVKIDEVVTRFKTPTQTYLRE